MSLKNAAFTLTEILIVVIIISIIAGFGLPNYYKNYERSLLKSAISQLKAIERAQKMYHQRNGYFFPDNGTETDIEDINDGLKVHLASTAFTYECSDTDNDNDKYTCSATRDGSTYVAQVTESASPTCVSGASCP